MVSHTSVAVGTHWVQFNDNCLGEPEEDQECKKDNKVAAPKVICIKVVTSLDVIFASDNAAPGLRTEQCAYLVRAQFGAVGYIKSQRKIPNIERNFVRIFGGISDITRNNISAVARELCKEKLREMMQQPRNGEHVQ